MAAPNIVQSPPSTFHHLLCVSVALTASALGPDTSVEQSFTIAGLQAADALEPADQILTITKATYQQGLTLGFARVVTPNTLAVTFINSTTGSVTPTAGDIYTFVVFRPNHPIVNVVGTGI